MAVEFASREISEKYDRFARWYDWVEGVPDLLGVKSFRRRLLARASGRVLDVAAGTGKNLTYYPRNCRIIALDLSDGMLKVARARAANLSMHVSFLIGDAAALPFPDRSFDTVVSSLSACTLQIQRAPLQRWRAFVERMERSFYWSTAAANANG